MIGYGVKARHTPAGSLKGGSEPPHGPFQAVRQFGFARARGGC